MSDALRSSHRMPTGGKHCWTISQPESSPPTPKIARNIPAAGTMTAVFRIIYPSGFTVPQLGGTFVRLRVHSCALACTVRESHDTPKRHRILSFYTVKSHIYWVFGLYLAINTAKPGGDAIYM